MNPPFRFSPLQTRMEDLFAAILAKDRRSLRALADAGEDVNAVNAEGLTPLAVAVKANFIAGISYLLGLADTDANKGKPVDTEQPLKDDTSPLMIGAELNRKMALEIMLGYPSVDVNHTNAGGDTALHIALRNGATKSLPVLLEAFGIDVNKSNVMKETPLFLAAVTKNSLATEALLLKGADVNAETNVHNLKGVPLTIANLALRQKFEAEINRMIRNMASYGKTYNAPPMSTVIPLDSLEDLHLDIYPRTEKAVSLLTKLGEPTSHYPVHTHSMAESLANVPNFLRSVSLVRHMCVGLEENYVAIKMNSIDYYVTLTHGAENRLLGFYLIEIKKNTLLLSVICTRNTIKGAGSALMNFLLSNAKPGTVKRVLLDSVESAKGFYTRLGFKSMERTMDNITGDTWPMTYNVRATTGASAGAGAVGSAGNTTRRSGAGTSGGARKTRRAHHR